MNYLQLGQRLALECGVSGVLSTMQNLSGEQLRVATWINQGWLDVQTEHDDWNWMLSSNLLGGGVSFTSVGGASPVQASYPLGTGAGTVGITAANFGKWKKNTFRTYATAGGFANETFLDQIQYDTWRNSYMYGAQRNVQTRPVAVAIGPDESLCLGPPPAAGYTITGDYFMAPSTMSADIDTPTNLPAAFHMLIVYKAMMGYAGYESASEVYQRGQEGWDLMLPQLEAIKMPQVIGAGALA